MVTIKGTTIQITRGDSASIAVTIYNADGTVYHPAAGDSVRFAVKKNYDDPQPVILKTIPRDTMRLVLAPSDTKTLEAGQQRGRYHYDIELTKTDGTVDTFIPRADFIVLEEVY